ncbi:MAG: hypothetical protein Q8904_16205 [Bacteroidota bacterium]|nr:hypothetical protein [Bacteroidota bacterium]
MNWKLILQLSLFGLVMAFATVFWIPSHYEPLFWLVIFLICAYFIARKCSTKYFWNGFMVSLVNCVWITSAHIIFIQTYLTNHANEASMLAKMPLPESPRLMMLMTGPFIGVISGIILGLIALIASKLIKKKD